LIIAIDGPAASGKSTIAKEIAKRLNYKYLDTGAMYRALTWKVLKNEADFSDEMAIVEFVKDTKVYFEETIIGGKLIVKTYLDDDDVTEEIRLSEVSNHVSLVAKISAVREVMVKLQQELAINKNFVVEGRDIGTHVFPDADHKFFLTASTGERAKRRYLELKEKSHEVEASSVEHELISRDTIDSTRSASPLAKAPDAYVLDTTEKSIDEVVEEILKAIKGEN